MKTYSPELECIIDAFHEIENKDIRVGRVTLEKDKYLKLASSWDFARQYINNPILMQNEMNAIMGATYQEYQCRQGHRFVGTLWGAGIEIGNESRVYGKPGYLPGPVFHFTEGPIPEYSVEIDFSGMRIKIKEMRNKLRNNITIIVKSRTQYSWESSYNPRLIPKNEWAAIDTLRDMITEKEFRKYMTYGFILVKGSSGKVYQIFRNRAHAHVWENGEKIEEICVMIKDSKVPLTDKLIAFKTMIECNEEEFRSLANIYTMKKAA